MIQQSRRPLLSVNRMRSNACVLIRTLPEVREEQKNPAMAGPASLPNTGPCGAHGASDDDLEVPHRAPSKSISRLQAVRKCPILSSVRCRTEGKSLGMLSGWCRKLRKNKRMQRWLHRPRPSTGPCGAHGASTGRLEYLWGLLESFCFMVSGCVSCHLNLVPAHVELTVPLGD